MKKAITYYILYITYCITSWFPIVGVAVIGRVGRLWEWFLPFPLWSKIGYFRVSEDFIRFCPKTPVESLRALGIKHCKPYDLGTRYFVGVCGYFDKILTGSPIPEYKLFIDEWLYGCELKGARRMSTGEPYS